MKWVVVGLIAGLIALGEWLIVSFVVAAAMTAKVVWMIQEGWDEWRGGTWRHPKPAMLIKHLWAWRGYRVDVHKFIGADVAGCFHTHPATAIRIVLWGGYYEEVKVRDDEIGSIVKSVRVGHIGIVRPEYTHRIAGLLNGRSSWSLWLRGPVTHKINVERCE